jgi:predicted Zn-dependent protease
MMNATEKTFQEAETLLRDGQFTLALERAHLGLRHCPDNSLLWQLHGIALCNLGEFREARRSLETATTLGPLRAQGRCCLADCYAKLGSSELARWMYRRLAADRAVGANLLPAIASGAGAVGDYRCALRVCRRLVRLNPEHHQGLFGVAFYLERLGAPATEVVNWVDQAFRLKPRSMTYRLSLATVFCELRRWDEASELLDALPIESACPGALRRMSALYARIGAVGRAQACRKRADGAQGV